MKKTAVFPGSFDPLTLGHTDIIDRGIPLFDEIIIAIGTNSSKNYMFSLEERKEFIEKNKGDFGWKVMRELALPSIFHYKQWIINH